MTFDNGAFVLFRLVRRGHAAINPQYTEFPCNKIGDFCQWLRLGVVTKTESEPFGRADLQAEEFLVLQRGTPETADGPPRRRKNRTPDLRDRGSDNSHYRGEGITVVG